MIKSNYLGFLVFVAMLIVFFIIPDPEGIQKIFRIILGLFFVYIYFNLLIKRDVSIKTLLPIAMGGLIILIMISRGTIQSSFINAYFCLFGLIIMPKLFFELTSSRESNLNYIHILCIFSILIQFLLNSSADGRPSLVYEINLSGAYLFLFFIYSDILKNKYGKLLVLTLSLFTLSRLLIFSIIIFYILRYTKKYFKVLLNKMNFSRITILSYIFFTLFSIWYVTNVKAEIDYDTSINRIATINDGSNKLRFLANVMVINTIFSNPSDPRILFGFGPIENYINATEGSLIMPHNELFDSMIQFGIITIIFFSFFSFSAYNKVTSYDNIEYLIPLILYTLILWVRFLIVPSFEMLFILFLLQIVYKSKNAIQ